MAFKVSIQEKRVNYSSIKAVERTKNNSIALTLVTGTILNIPFWKEKNPTKACNKAIVSLMNLFKHDKDVVFKLN